MKNADDSTPSQNILPEDSDLGPEPDWLLDDDVQEQTVESAPKDEKSLGEGAQSADTRAADSELPVEDTETDSELQSVEHGPMDADVIQESESMPPPPPSPMEPGTTAEFLPSRANATTSDTDEPGVPATEKKSHPWLWGLTPFVLLLATGLIAWFGTTQTLNGLATWDAIRSQSPPLLPARWAMMIWWLVLPLMMIFLIYGSLPAGRDVTRIKFTGPLVTIGLGATAFWIFAQHWQWEVAGIVSMAIASLATLTTYLLVVLGPNIQNLRQRMIAVVPLSAALGYSVMLTVLAWQSYSSQPFGERGSSVLFALLLVVIAAVFAFFLRDGLFPLVLAIWFGGVVHQQWGEDAVISLVAAVAVLFTGALAVLGTILASESHRPSLTTSVENRRGRTSFFKKSEDSPPE